MKKFSILSLVLVLVIGLTACSKTNSRDNKNKDPDSTTVHITQETLADSFATTTESPVFVTTTQESAATTDISGGTAATTTVTSIAAPTATQSAGSSVIQTTAEQSTITKATVTTTTANNLTTAVATKAPTTTKKTSTTAKPVTTMKKATTTTKATTATTKKQICTHFINYDLNGRWYDNNLTAVPVEVWWENSELVVKCQIVNGYANRTAYNVCVKQMTISNDKEVIASGRFSTNQNLTIDPLSYVTHTFHFSGSDIVNPGADLTYILASVDEGSMT